MGKTPAKLLPKWLTSYLNKKWKAVAKKTGIRKYLPAAGRAGRFVFRWRVFWTLVLLLAVAVVYYPAVGDPFIDFMARRKPPFAKLPANARLDYRTTVEYKKEKILVVRTNLNNVATIIMRDLGLKDGKGNRKLVSISAALPVTANVEKPFVPVQDDRPAQGDFSIIRDNLVDAVKAYFDMLTVRIVMIDNKPVMVGNDGELVPYDKTDRILRWARYIEAASRKYNVEPAVIAAIIEQESGGNASVVSHAGAVGLMQLMPRTAKGLGVNPYDPAQNIDGGTRYFLYQYRAFGNVEQALAAYNAGPNNVRNGNYLYIPETQGYITKVPRLITKYQRLFAQMKK